MKQPGTRSLKPNLDSNSTLPPDGLSRALALIRWTTLIAALGVGTVLLGGALAGGNTNAGDANGGNTNVGERAGGNTNAGDANGGNTNAGALAGGNTNAGALAGGNTNAGALRRHVWARQRPAFEPAGRIGRVPASHPAVIPHFVPGLAQLAPDPDILLIEAP